MSVAGSVALVSEHGANETASPQLQPSVSGEQEPAALWSQDAYPTEVGAWVLVSL